MICIIPALACLTLAATAHGTAIDVATTVDSSPADAEHDGGYDIVVYGGSSAGVVAAIQGARMGKRVVLVSHSPHVGGLTVSGLSATDIDDYRSIGGIAAEFYRRIYDYYLSPDAWRTGSRDEYFRSIRRRVYSGRNERLRIQWVFEPHVAERILRMMLLSSGAEIAANERLNRANGVGVQLDGALIKSITMESGRTFRAAIFIDASYEGDLMAAAGVTYTVGREARSTYHESYAGVRTGEIYGERKSVDPFFIPGDPGSGPLPYVDRTLVGSPGEGDGRVQTYCYRLTLSKVADNRMDITRPADYDPRLYEYLARRLQSDSSLTLQRIMTLTPMPNGKTDTNGIDFVGANYDYPEGSYARRAEIENAHRSFALGMLWFLKSDLRAPEHIRVELAPWGLAKDEFEDNGNFPPHLYVREARRMVSDYVMTEQNALGTKVAPDSIGVASYALDCHRVARFVDQNGELRDEGNYFRSVPSYRVSYRSIRPRKHECPNLLVPVALSASHVACCSIRMEPVYMVLGQSAATAAALAIDSGVAVQDVDYAELRDCLLRDGQFLAPR